MSKNFLKFKRKLNIAAIVKSLMLGLSVGTLAFSALYIWQKLTSTEPKLLFCIAVGAACAFLGTVVAFLFMRPTDIRVARKLDRELSLGEKVQTMLFFKNETGDVIEMQRKDTEERLGQVKRRSVRIWNLWKHIIAPVVAVCVIAVAIVVPTKVVEPEKIPEEPEFELTNWQAAALAELIDDVRKSKMEDFPKQLVLFELEELLEFLLDDISETESEVQARVKTVINDIIGIEDAADSYDEISLSLDGTSVTELQRLGDGLSSLNGLKLRTELDKIRESFAKPEALETFISDYVSRLNEALVSSGYDTNDLLFKAVEDFGASLSELLESMPSYTQAWAQSQLDLIFEGAANSMSNALYLQKNNDDTVDYTLKRLVEIFEIEDVELGEDGELSGSDPDDDDDNDDPLQDGGIGSGDIVYGSDDQIYDPDTNENVKYGSVINEYYAKITEKLLDGNVSEELEKYISDYFASLYDGTEKDAE